jgi:acetoacetyl-CoA synthetase
MARFMQLAAKRDYAELHRWSVEKSEDFWDLMWRFGEVRGAPGTRRLLNPERMPGAQWFPDARLNFAENLLRGSATTRSPSPSGARRR